MGEQSRSALRRALNRRKLPSADRDTLTTCPACNGSEPKLIEDRVGGYRKISCRWCHGLGCLDKEMLLVFARAVRIYGFNTIAGRCKDKLRL